MNKLNVKVQIKGRGVIMANEKNPMEQFVEKEVVENKNEAVPAPIPVENERHAIEDLIEEVEGSVEKSKAPDDFLSTADLKQSTRKRIDPSETVNAIKDDDEHDGGIMENQTAIPQDADGEQLKERGTNTEDDTIRDKYEVTGFTVQYTPANSLSKGIISEAVRDFYDGKIEDVLARFKEGTYQTPNNISARITSGAPIICYNDRQILEYIDEAWRRA